jgi:hypothetical protein
MIDYSNSTLDKVSVHQVGNKNNGEDIIISKQPLDTSDPIIKELLQKFFLAPFKTAEFYNFTFTNQDHTMNPLFNYSTQIFDGISDFHLNSINIAKHLFETSNHPQIKSGDLFIAHFSNLRVEYKEVNAIGIFKSENRQAFLKLNNSKSDFLLNYEEGINIDKLDKGCLIIDSDIDKGYKVCIIDKGNKSGEAQFWKDMFLMLKPCSDDYHQTSDFLQIAKNFVTTQLNEDFEVNKTDQIDLLNRSMEYFKTHDDFKKEEFEEQVFQDDSVINSFRKFDQQYRQENAIELEDEFEISLPAVKKQAKVYKSILKLDKNFHIYIHGNKEMIEHGVEKDGRKFYKIYYEKEA